MKGLEANSVTEQQMALADSSWNYNHFGLSLNLFKIEINS